MSCPYKNDLIYSKKETVTISKILPLGQIFNRQPMSQQIVAMQNETKIRGENKLFNNNNNMPLTTSDLMMEEHD